MFKKMIFIAGITMACSDSVMAQYNAGYLKGSANSSASVSGIGFSSSQVGGTFSTTAGFSDSKNGGNLSIAGYSTGDISGYVFNVSQGGGAGFANLNGLTQSGAKDYSDFYAPGQSLWVSGKTDSGWFDTSKGTNISLSTKGVNTGVQGSTSTSGKFTVDGSIVSGGYGSDGKITAVTTTYSTGNVSAVVVDNIQVTMGSGAVSGVTSVIAEGEFIDPRVTTR